MSIGPTFTTVVLDKQGPIEHVAQELREVLNADAQNSPPFPTRQERDSLNHNGEYWLFGLLGVEVLLLNGDDFESYEISVATHDHGFAESLAARLARIFFELGYKVALV